MGVLTGSIVVTAVRNEGPFLLEWIAWQKMLGFEDILIVHNDCTDHSPQLLRLLERHGVLTQKSHKPDPAKPPQPQAHILASKHKLVREATWAFVCDVDEFLVIHVGDGGIDDLLEGGTLPIAGMAINWRIFGTMGETEWRDALVHRRFTRAAETRTHQNTGFKSFTRAPRLWGRLRSHGPKLWQGPGDWDEGENVILLSNGDRLEGYTPNGKPLNASPRAQIAHGLAQVNHYALQTREQFLHKKGRPSPAEHLDRYTDLFFQRFDHNEEEDRTIEKYAERFDAEYAKLTAIAGAMRLHHLCCADFVVAMVEKQGRDPAADPRLADHRAKAAALPRH